LLSCFVVSDEIVVITRSAKEGNPTMEWRGRPDGTYTIKTLEGDFQPGTQVYLTGKKGSEEYFTPEKVRELALHFGGLLPFPIRVIAGKDNRCIDEDGPPWRRKFAKREQETKALIEYGRQMFQTPFFDAVKLHSAVGEVEGVAFVLP